MEGNPRFVATQQIPDVPYHKLAELIGLKGIFCDDPEQVGAAWDEALASRVPVVLEVKTDPEVPPLPPHINLTQAKKFMRSEEHTSELQSLMRISYAVFCLKKTKKEQHNK